MVYRSTPRTAEVRHLLDRRSAGHAAGRSLLSLHGPGQFSPHAGRIENELIGKGRVALRLDRVSLAFLGVRYDLPLKPEGRDHSYVVEDGWPAAQMKITIAVQKTSSVRSPGFVRSG